MRSSTRLPSRRAAVAAWSAVAALLSAGVVACTETPSPASPENAAAGASALSDNGPLGPSPAPEPPKTTTALAPEAVSFKAGQLELRGFVHRPEGAGPFPTVVYNHGSERKPGEKEELGHWFAERGFVVLVPHRRGHGQSPGENVKDYKVTVPEAERPTRVLEELQRQVEDVTGAIDFARTLPYVDKGRMAVAGCSYGGIETLLTAERDVGIRVAINFAAAAQSWGSKVLQERLKTAVKASRVPIFSLHAENDHSTDPGKALSAAARGAGRPHAMRIFPRYGETANDGHAGFCFKGMSVWGGDVVLFLRHYMQ